MQPDIIAYGEPMVEFNQTGGAGSRNYLQGFGGDTSNAMIAAARQGAKAGYLTALGDDAYGRMFRDLWAAEKVDFSRVKTDPLAPTAVYFVTHDADGHHFSFFRKGSAASRYAPPDVPVDYVAGAKILHVSGISLAISDSACDAGFAAMEAARAAGVRVSIDTNLRLKLWPKTRARAILTEAIRLSDIALPSYDDIIAMGGPAEPDRIIDDMLEHGASIVALKMGAKGAIVADGARRVAVPPHPCKPVDATGAGDCFGGSFLARLAAGDDMVAAARYAGVAAALQTEGYGAVDPIPNAERVRAALNA
ncbi:MAG: sugar kinase [Proteobacteria bacterium]|nr:sugar kinase [Pseudomonadota bacterium]